MSFIRYADLDESMRRFADGEDDPPHTITVWMHDSGLIAKHNQPCYVCFSRHALLTMTQTEFGGAFSNTFQPCSECQAKGWGLTKTPAASWWAFWRRVVPSKSGGA